jgi:hypothetical protein
MPTYQKAPSEVRSLATAVLNKHATHAPLLSAAVKIDYLFAYPRYNEKDEPIGDAIKHHGVKALGLARIVNLKDRTKGMGDAEILLDYEWWKDAPEPEQESLLDHELHHLSVNVNKLGIVMKDDLDRPKLRLRKHDRQFGWFDIVAERNGAHSMEQKQASEIFVQAGQLYWPQIAAANRGEDRGETAARAIRRIQG